MYQTPIKLNTQNFKNINFKDSDFDNQPNNFGYLSSRDCHFEPLQFTGTNHLQSLLVEMDALREEMEQKMHTYKPSPDLKNNLNPKSLKFSNNQEKNYQLRVQDLKSQISELKKLFQKEEDEHDKEKAKWSEQVNILKTEIGEKVISEKQKKVRVEERVLKENRKPEVKESEIFGKGSKEFEEMKEKISKIIWEKQVIQEDRNKMEAEIRILREEMRVMKEENRSLKDKEIGISNEVVNRYREIEEEKNRLIEENRCLKEKFSVYQEEQGIAIEKVSSEMNALVNLVNYIMSQKAQRT